MKRFLVLFVALIPLLAVAQTDVGMELPSALIPKKNHNQCAATPSQFYPCLQNVTIDGVRYAVVGYDQHTRRVKYLSTHDESFRTKDGLRVGAVTELSEDELVLVTGWNIIGPRTPDGWRPIYGSFLDGHVIRSVEGDAVDLKEPIAGKKHRFKIVSFDKGGV